MTILNTLWNGDFEDAAAGTTGWAPGAGNTMTRQTSDGSQGPAYLDVTFAAAGVASLRGPFVPCVEGHTVRFGLNLRLPVLAGVWSLGYSWYDATKSAVLSNSTTTGVTLTTSWARYSPPAIEVPTGAEFFRCWINRAAGGGGANAHLHVDAVVYTAQHRDLTDTLDTAWLAYAERPSFILYQLDDTPLNIMPFCDAYNTMVADGISFGFNTIGPICGPSRAATLTGQPPTVNGVVRNENASQIMLSGGWEPLTFLAVLRHHGYHTGLSGKWNNNQRTDGAAGWPDNHCPVGIDDWYSTDDDGFSQHGVYKWSIRKNGVSSKYTTTMGTPAEYANTMQENHATGYLADRDADTTHQPFVLMVNMRSTHDRATPDPEATTGRPKHPERYDHRPLRATRPGTWPALDPDYEEFGFLGELSPGVLRTPDDIGDPIAPNTPDWVPAWNTIMNRYPAWHTGEVLTPAQLATARENSLEQIRQLQSVGELVENVIAEAASLGFTNLHNVFFSDNGMREGWHATTYGKQMHYRHTIEMPLVWVGPGVEAGVDFYDDERIFTQLDLFPTLCDLGNAAHPVMPGRSLVPFFDGDGPATWRVTGFALFRAPGESWESKIGDGEPGGWGGLHSKQKWYTTYSGGSTPPPGERAEFYGLTEDPAQLNNIWTFAGAEQQAAINAHFQTYYTATGDDFWQAGLVELVGPEDESGGPGEAARGRWFVNGHDITTQAYNVAWGGALTAAAGRRGSDVVVPGFIGNQYVPGVPGAARGVLRMWVKGCDTDGAIPVAGAVATVRDNLDFLSRLFDVSTVNGVNNLIPMVREYPDGISRTCHIHVRDALDYSALTAGALGRLDVLVEIPRGAWYDGVVIEEIMPYTKPPPGSVIRFDEFAGATGHLQDFTLTLRGKFPGLELSDPTSGATKIRYTGDLDTNETLVLNNYHRVATWTAADGTTTEDHSHLVERVRGPGGGPWLTLVPMLALGTAPPGTIGSYRVEVEIDDDADAGAEVTLRSPLGRWFKHA